MGRITADANGRPAPAPRGTGLTAVSATPPLTLTLNGSVLTGSVDLSGATSDLEVQKAGVEVGTRPTLNLTEGANVTLTMADDVANNRVNVAIAATGGGGGALPSDTVVAETTSGQASSPGTADTFSRGDHTHGTPISGSGGGGLVFAQTEDVSLAGVITDETSLVGAGVGSVTLAAGSLTVGQTIRVTGSIYIDSAGATTWYSTLKVKIGAGCVLANMQIGIYPYAGTAISFEGVFTVRTIGVAGQVMGQGTRWGGGGQGSMSPATAGTVDTTVANTIDVTWRFEPENPNDGSITSKVLLVEVLG